MRVLYLNHTATIGGAEQSLLTLLAALPADFAPAVACPAGALAEEARALGVPVTEIPGTAASLKIHPRHTTAGVIELARAAREVRAVLLRGCDVVHANTIRAALVSALAAARTSAVRVSHVRDCLPDSAAVRVTRTTLIRTSDAILFNSRYTRDRFMGDRHHPLLRVVDNPVDLDRFDPARYAGRGVTPNGPADERRATLAVVAQLTPWKGQEDAVRTLALLRAQGRDSRLLLIGSAKFTSEATRYDNVTYERRLRDLAHSLDVADHVQFLGERTDVPAILAEVDILLLPSWEEPFGRALIEAMAMGVPVAATEVGGPPEIVRNGVEGLLLPPRRPEVWAEALGRLLQSPATRARMGRSGREVALERFSPRRHAEAVRAAYAAALAAGSSR